MKLMRILLPNRDFTHTVNQKEWIRLKYSHRYFCKNQIKNIDTVGAIKECPECGSSDIQLLEKRKPMTKWKKFKTRVANRVVKSYVKNRWPAKKTMDRFIDLKRKIFS